MLASFDWIYAKKLMYLLVIKQVQRNVGQLRLNICIFSYNIWEKKKKKAQLNGNYDCSHTSWLSKTCKLKLVNYLLKSQIYPSINSMFNTMDRMKNLSKLSFSTKYRLKLEEAISVIRGCRVTLSSDDWFYQNEFLHHMATSDSLTRHL